MHSLQGKTLSYASYCRLLPSELIREQLHERRHHRSHSAPICDTMIKPGFQGKGKWLLASSNSDNWISQMINWLSHGSPLWIYPYLVVFYLLLYIIHKAVSFGVVEVKQVQPNLLVSPFSLPKGFARSKYWLVSIPRLVLVSDQY